MSVDKAIANLDAAMMQGFDKIETKLIQIQVDFDQIKDSVIEMQENGIKRSNFKVSLLNFKNKLVSFVCNV